MKEAVLRLFGGDAPPLRRTVYVVKPPKPEWVPTRRLKDEIVAVLEDGPRTASDIARVLSAHTKCVTRSLFNLEKSGRVRHAFPPGRPPDGPRRPVWTLRK